MRGAQGTQHQGGFRDSSVLTKIVSETGPGDRRRPYPFQRKIKGEMVSAFLFTSF